MEDDRQFEDASLTLYAAERELLIAMQNFVDAQAAAGKSKSRALDILRQLLLKSRDEKAKRCRAAFKIVDE